MVNEPSVFEPLRLYCIAITVNLIFIFVNIHICMLIFTPQFDVFFIYYAHAYLFTLVLFVYLLLKRAPRKIGYQPVGLPSQNKEFTYLLTY